MSKSPVRLSRLAASLACGAAFTFLAPAIAPVVGFNGPALAQGAGQVDQHRQVLLRYGAFQAHARYGEVWIPAEQVAPRGWHPYPPCNWVHHKELGWLYDDRTEWGAIVHHYGRWAHDAALGWVWVPGSEYSPGWVVWRTSETWVGWAPMPPEQDIKEISADAFNSDKHWIFMDAKKFGTRCQDGSGLAQSVSYPTIFQSTRLVTEIRFVRGIAIFVLPPPLVINIVDIDIGIVPPWSPCFFGAWFWNWNWLVNNVVININLPAGPAQCAPAPVLIKPFQQIKSDPPPAPGGKLPPAIIVPPKMPTPPQPPQVGPRQPERQTLVPPSYQPPPRIALPNPPAVRPGVLVPPVRIVDPMPPRRPDPVGRQPNRQPPRIVLPGVDKQPRPQGNPGRPSIDRASLVNRPQLLRGPTPAIRPPVIKTTATRQQVPNKFGLGAGGMLR